LNHSRTFAELNFWRFFWSTVLSIVGMDLYLFTHGWYLIELGGDKLSIGVSWAIFFVPSLLMLPVCARLLKEYSVRNVQLGFEVAKAAMLWVALLWLFFFPSLAAVYILSACFGLLFSPFYPATYTLLKGLFADDRVVRYSNLFEVSLQLAGAMALFASGFLYDRSGFIGIVFASAIAVTASCGFLLRLESFGTSQRSPVSWLQSYWQFFKLPSPRELIEFRFLAGLTHQIPQSAVLLSNIPMILYVSQRMHGGPLEYGYLDALYGVVGLGTSLFWTKWPELSKSSVALLLASALGTLGFVAFGAFPATSFLPYLYISILAAGLTSTKVMARATYIESSSKEFVTSYSPLFQLVSNAVLVLGAYFSGALMESYSDSVAMLALALMIGGFTLFFPWLQLKLREERAQ
jgi:MFS family permease